MPELADRIRHFLFRVRLAVGQRIDRGQSFDVRRRFGLEQFSAQRHDAGKQHNDRQQSDQPTHNIPRGKTLGPQTGGTLARP